MQISAYNFMGIQVRNQAQVGPAGKQADVGDVADLNLLGAGNHQLVEQIRPA